MRELPITWPLLFRYEIRATPVPIFTPRPSLLHSYVADCALALRPAVQTGTAEAWSASRLLSHVTEGIAYGYA